MPPDRVVTYAQVLQAAHVLFERTGGLDTAELARALSVSRATLYRVAHSRDTVLGDVLWEQGRATTLWAVSVTTGRGADRLLAVSRRFNERVVAAPALRRLVTEDPATAFRVLFSPETRVHARFVELWRDLLRHEVDLGALDLAIDVDELAYVYVRMGESVLYADLLCGRQPDLDLAEAVQRSLLTAR